MSITWWPAARMRPDPRPAVRGLLFDLDGTFADTAPDLAAALNWALQCFGREPLPYERIRPQVSHGARALIRLGFGEEAEAPRQELLRYYRDNIARHTTLFPGMAEVLEALETAGLPWGIVTNKPAYLTEPLMQGLGLFERAGCIVSGDTTPNPKPHPEPILLACRRIATPPEHCLYVGDAARDIEAGRAAGTGTLAALFGYLDEQDRPESWGADGLVRSPAEILTWLGR
jgi:N-acetyl-D-muramate 6-phosphate phosphatase